MKKKNRYYSLIINTITLSNQGLFNKNDNIYNARKNRPLGGIPSIYMLCQVYKNGNLLSALQHLRDCCKLQFYQFNL